MDTGAKVAIGVGVAGVVLLILWKAGKGPVKTVVRQPDTLPKGKIEIDASDVEPIPGVPYPDGNLGVTEDMKFGPSFSAQPEGGGRWKVTHIDGTPVTADPEEARSKAQSTADHVRTKSYGYDRPRLAVWQALAGVSADGLYGPSTEVALRDYGAVNVPKALFKGAGVSDA